MQQFVTQYVKCQLSPDKYEGWPVFVAELIKPTLTAKQFFELWI